MSYILEALKKAQAERQLGNAPTIHAPVQSYAGPAAGPGGKRRHVALGLVGGALLALAALWWMRQESVPGPAVLAQAPAPVRSAPVIATPAARAPIPAPAPAPVRVTVPVPVPAPVPVPVPAPAPAPVPAPAAVPVPVTKTSAPAQPATVKNTAPAAPRVAAPAPEETVRTLQQLPEALQREIPKVVVGGYIYSPDPAERLLLVDKMLRREGEEVAPGLVLERLLPKSAVMNYRGTRYRVGY